MRINQLVSNFQAMQSISAQAKAGTGAAVSASAAASADPTMTTPGLERAVRANQARFDEASKGYVQAARTRDAVATVYGGLGKARDAVKRLQAHDLTAAQRTQAQKDLQAAFTQMDSGAKSQATTAVDGQLRNKAFDPSRVAPLSADQLGNKTSTKYASVAALKTVDFSKATSSDLAAAAKVLEAAQQQVSTQRIVAQAQTDRLAGRVTQTQSTLETLGVKTGDAANTNLSADQQIIKQLQALTQPSPTVPGGLFYGQA